MNLEEELAYIQDKETTDWWWQYSFHKIFITTGNASTHNHAKLLDVLRKHRGAINHSVDDTKRLSPLRCIHCIFLGEGHRPFRQPQRRLNPNMQEVVKLLDAWIIYPIW